MPWRRSVSWPIILGVTMILLLSAILVGWIILTVRAAQGASFWWVFLAVGSTFLGLCLVGVILYLALSVKEIRLNQRQSNFIDSVTHELKSPIASLKLYLQTLTRRQVTPEQQADFHRYMLDDLERLDALINHLLDAARIDQQPRAAEIELIDLPALLRTCAASVCQRHRVPPETIVVDADAAQVRARPLDCEMIFRNLLDNAVKYSGEPPAVRVESRVRDGGLVVTRVIDNGPGIPEPLRGKIFGRFVRLGNELERVRTGTGLGLFIVRTLVRRMKGRVSVQARGAQSGAVFEVQLPLAGGPPDARSRAA